MIQKKAEAQRFDIDLCNPMGSSMVKLCSISEAAERAGISVHQARKYLYAGLIGNPARNRHGRYRLDENCLRRLRIIGLATDAGLLIREIKPLLYELDRVAGPRAERVRQHWHVLEQKIRDRRQTMEDFEQRLDRVCCRSQRDLNTHMET